MSVHHIDVNKRSSAVGSAANLIRKMREVRRKYRRCQFDQTWSYLGGSNLLKMLVTLCEILAWVEGAPGPKPRGNSSPRATLNNFP